MRSCKDSSRWKERLLVHRLHRARDVAVALLERIVGLAARPQQLLERRREEIADLRRAVATGRRPARVMAEVAQIEPNAPSGRSARSGASPP